MSSCKADTALQAEPNPCLQALESTVESIAIQEKCCPKEAQGSRWFQELVTLLLQGGCWPRWMPAQANLAAVPMPPWRVPSVGGLQGMTKLSAYGCWQGSWLQKSTSCKENSHGSQSTATESRPWCPAKPISAAWMLCLSQSSAAGTSLQGLLVTSGHHSKTTLFPEFSIATLQ